MLMQTQTLKTQIVFSPIKQQPPIMINAPKCSNIKSHNPASFFNTPLDILEHPLSFQPIKDNT